MVEDEVARKGTVKHFEDWVFHKTNPDYIDPNQPSTIKDRLELGRIGHEEIERYTRLLRKVSVTEGTSSSWELLYADPHDGSDTRSFRASRLIVDGVPLCGKPDVAFQDRRTETVLLLERKVTSWDEDRIPEDAWPNIRAQLWCYAWMDEWIEARQVIVVCHFWQRRLIWGAGPHPRQDPENPWIWTHARPEWHRNDPQFHSECLNYFIKYGGEFAREGVAN